MPLTVDQLVDELHRLQQRGLGEAPVWVRRGNFGGDFEDEPATIACVLPYVERDKPERVLID